MSESKKRFKTKNYYQQMNKKKRVLNLEPGMKGFFCTCNFEEKNCVREAYNLLNEYADKLNPSQEVNLETTEDCNGENDISDELEKQISELKSGSGKNYRFLSIPTTVDNCIFIKSNIENTLELGYSIVKDIHDTKCQKTRFLLRLVPIEATCSAKIPDIVSTAGKLFDQHFLSEPTTFSIVFNRRYNNSVPRDAVIKELAELIVSKNCNHKVDLTKAKTSVIVEVVKGICLLSVVPDYFLYKKYNLFELCNQKPPAEDNTENNEKVQKLEQKDDDGQKDVQKD